MLYYIFLVVIVYDRRYRTSNLYVFMNYYKKLIVPIYLLIDLMYFYLILFNFFYIRSLIFIVTYTIKFYFNLFIFIII